MKLVFVAGQVGMDYNGKVADTYEVQVEQTVKYISTCLAAAATKVTDIIKITYYSVNYHHTNRLHVPIVLKFPNGRRCATMLVPVTCFAKPKFLFEMNITAAIPRERAIGDIPKSILPASTDTTVDVVVVGVSVAFKQDMTARMPDFRPLSSRLAIESEVKRGVYQERRGKA
jgi:enamine deaminase RidA (YjgF/YER057c/UK114 family)